jgi:hypothetical protein
MTAAARPVAYSTVAASAVVYLDGLTASANAHMLTALSGALIGPMARAAAGDMEARERLERLTQKLIVVAERIRRMKLAVDVVACVREGIGTCPDQDVVAAFGAEHWEIVLFRFIRGAAED